MDKLDLKKADRPFYAGKVGQWTQITLPAVQYLAIEGRGDPGGADYAAALAALYPLAYGIKFAQTAEGRDFVVPPLSAVWWSDDLDAFTSNARESWQWRAMIRMPDYVTQADFAAAKVSKKVEAPVELISVEEGLCLQTLHVGPYTDEGPVLADLHDNVMPAMGLTFGEPHHEIYLSDPRRVAAEKLRTILRQPVKPL